MTDDEKKKNKVDMDEQFDVISLSRNDILARFGDEEAPLENYAEVKTILENMSDDDMVNFIEELCGFKHIFDEFNTDHDLFFFIEKTFTKH